LRIDISSLKILNSSWSKATTAQKKGDAELLILAQLEQQPSSPKQLSFSMIEKPPCIHPSRRAGRVAKASSPHVGYR
jgi:hypothetical protein